MTAEQAGHTQVHDAVNNVFDLCLGRLRTSYLFVAEYFLLASIGLRWLLRAVPAWRHGIHGTNLGLLTMTYTLRRQGGAK